MGRKIKKSTAVKKHAHWQAEQILTGFKLCLEAGAMKAGDRESFYHSICKQLWDLKGLPFDTRYGYVRLARQLYYSGFERKPSGPTLVFERETLTSPKEAADYKKRMRLCH